MPALPVPLRPAASTRFAVRNVARSSVGDVVHELAERGVEVADRRLGERVEHALRAPGSGPSRAAGGRGERRSRAPPRPGSARRGARAARRGSSARSSRRRDAEAREQLLLAPSVGTPLIVPAHGEPLEEELDRAVPGVLASAAAWPCSDRRVLAPRRRRHRAAQRRARSPSASRVRRSSARRACSTPARAGARARLPTSGRRGRALELRAHVAGQRLGVARASAAAGSSAASLRIDARACSVSRLNAACGTRGVAVAARLRVDACRSSRWSARAGRDSRHSAIMPGRVAGEVDDLEAATSSPSATVPGDLHRPAVPDRAAVRLSSEPAVAGRASRSRSSAQPPSPSASATVVRVAVDRHAERRRGAAVVGVAVAEHDARDAAELRAPPARPRWSSC